jgi:hypothetical protein
MRKEASVHKRNAANAGIVKGDGQGMSPGFQARPESLGTGRMF